MNALLYVLVGIAAINTLAVICDRFETHQELWHRQCDAVITLAIGAWALYLLAA